MKLKDWLQWDLLKQNVLLIHLNLIRHHFHKDIISKQIFKRIFIDVATYIFKLQLVEVELIETELQRVEERREV